MRRRRILASLVVVTLALLAIDTANAWMSGSQSVRFEITAADFDQPDDTGGKVWVCKLIGPPDEPRVKPGKNPIHVSIASLDAEQAFSDAHPSYVVEHAEVECAVPASTGLVEPPDRNVEPGPAGDDPGPEETTSTTADPGTTTTIVPASTITIIEEEASTTTTPEPSPQGSSTLPDNDEQKDPDV